MRRQGFSSWCRGIPEAHEPNNELKAASAKHYTDLECDQESSKTTCEALLVLSRANIDVGSTFWRKEDVDPVRHLPATAWGWWGLAEEEASYLNIDPKLPVGAYELNVQEVPVDAF